MPRLSLVTTCKPFTGLLQTIQENALRSWASLRPRCEVLVFGDEPGSKDVCEALGFRHFPDAKRNGLGTPLLGDMLEQANRAASSDTIAFVNADIMLTDSLLTATETVRESFPRFLLLVRRWNASVRDPWRFDSPASQQDLVSFARSTATLEPVYGGIDVFVFYRGLYSEVPPFAIGRGRWDSYLIADARRRRIPVVDATESCVAVHQAHDYEHIQGVESDCETSQAGKPAYASTAEGKENARLLGSPDFIATCLNATHELGPQGLRPSRTRNPFHLARKLAALPSIYPALRPFRPLIRLGLPIWRLARSRAVAGATTHPDVLYPISVRQRHAFRGYPSDGVESFEVPEARSINSARLEHLSSLGLPLSGRTVVDVGCGVGHLSRFFRDRGCQVVCLDGRQENIEQLRILYPGTDARVFDLESQSLSDVGEFDIVFCYGLLYHLENPFRALRSLASAAGQLLLLETQVSDHRLPLVVLEEETESFSQALHGVGSRPTPSFLALALREAGMPHVYTPRVPPDHPDFRFSWRNDLSSQRDGHLLRCTLVASRAPLESTALVEAWPPDP